MNNMKCPFCNKKLEPIGTSGQFQCGTWGCDASFNFIATRDVWEYIDRTKKQLEIAVDALKWIAYDENDEQDGLEEFAISQMVEKADEAIKQITALEQKDK